MDDDDGIKSPHELIDEEEKQNNPIKDTVDELEAEEELNKKIKQKEKEKEKERRRHDFRTKEEKERDQYKCKIDLATYKHRLQHLEVHLEQEQRRSDLKLEMELEDLDFQRKRRKITNKSDLLQSQLDLRAKQDKWNNLVEQEPEYLHEPLKIDPVTGQTELVISDRIIELSGVIGYWTSEYITDLIHYYNNRSTTLPIFLIIDYSPGGSVMSGYRILKAMETSPAPIYVVVKSYAASMAAMIASMAKHSFAYPNAIILHHQILSRSSGNLRQHKEQVKDLEEWFRRLAGPFAEKLNLTICQLVKMMYENNSDGDWKEFGDRAVELGWINQIVHRIRQTGNRSNATEDMIAQNICCKVSGKESKKRKRDEDNLSHEKTLKLKPMDYWWLYDPDNYYNVL